MFEKIGQSAENVVGKVSVSRRGFLGRAAKLAASVGAALATLATSPAEAVGPGWTGTYACPDGSRFVVKNLKGSFCPFSIRRKGMDCGLVGCTL